jgi:hypothetical protein
VQTLIAAKHFSSLSRIRFFQLSKYTPLDGNLITYTNDRLPTDWLADDGNTKNSIKASHNDVVNT